MGENAKKADPSGTGLIVACLAAVFIGLWMVGQSVATEGEAIKNQLTQLQTEVGLLNAEVKRLKSSSTALAVAPLAAGGDEAEGVADAEPAADDEAEAEAEAAEAE